MKHSAQFLTLASIVLLSAGTLLAQYSNATLNGPWFWRTIPLDPTPDTLVYQVFDGKGDIVDAGVFIDSVKGTYSVSPAGAITSTIYMDTSAFSQSGQFISQNCATLDIDSNNFLLSRITNPGALTDSLVGTLSTNGYGDKTITLRLNAEGQIISATGLAAPVSGRVYADSGVFAGHVKTGEPEPWNQFSIAGYYSNDSLNGRVRTDMTGVGGPALLIRKGTVTGVTRSVAFTPKAFALSQNYPNPFNPTTAIGYQLSEVVHVTLKVYDVLGREVATLVDGVKQPGSYEVKFDGSMLPSGVYFYRLAAGNRVFTKKMILMK